LVIVTLFIYHNNTEIKMKKKLLILSILVIMLQYFCNSQNSEWIIYNDTNSDLNNNKVESIALDSLNKKWIGCYLGYVVELDGKSWNSIEIPQAWNIFNIQVEKNGNIWACHDVGLSKYNGNEWIHFTPYNSQIPRSFIASIAFDYSGFKWLGTEGCNLIKFNDTTWVLISNVGSSIGYSQGQVYSIFIESNNKIWVGTGSDIADESIGVLGKFDNNQWIGFRENNSGMPFSNKIHQIINDKNYTMWIATSINGGYNQNMGGLVKFIDNDGDTSWTVYQTSNSGIPDNNVYAIAIDENNVKWLGTRGGLAKFDDTSWTVWNTDNSDIPSNTINCIVIDKYGNKWIGTDNGLAVFREGGVVGVEEPVSSKEFLFRFFPNPFSEKTEISFNLEFPSYTKIIVYNSLGYAIAVLSDEYLSEGRHEFTFDGSSLPSGTYYYVLQANGNVETGKLVLIK